MTPWTAAYQAPLSMGFSRQEYWSGVPLPSPEYCIGTWSVRSINQGKLEVVKLETARLNIDLLGISELKWTGMGEFDSDDHYIYYCGQESLRINGVAIIINKRVRNAVPGCNLKDERMISVCFQGKSFNIMVIQVHASTSNAEEAEVGRFYEDLQDFLEKAMAPHSSILAWKNPWTEKPGGLQCTESRTVGHDRATSL